MSNPQHSGKRNSILIGALALCAVIGGCSVAEPKATANTGVAEVVSSDPSANSEPAAKGATITIDPNGPADTVRVFYKLLREKKFREAMFLTNLRPAIEGLTEAELKDFSVDFEALAGQIPAEIEINGEIITGDKAVVTANLPNADGDKNEIQQIKLSKAGDVWVIMTADEEAAKKIKADGKNYFYNLRIEVHEEEAKRMLERISKAQLAYSFQHGGVCTDIQTLVTGGLLPPDIKTNASTGYDYAVELAADKRTYFATATPAEYRKSGVRSFLLKLDAKGFSVVTGKDNGGKPLRP